MPQVGYVHIVTRRLILMTAVALLVLGGIFGLTFFFGHRFMLSWASLMCGILGGFVSIQQRIDKVPEEELRLLSSSWFQVLLIPIFGGVFALVLYVLFLSGIVTGDLFPRFHIPEPTDGVPDDRFMAHLLTRIYPASGQDFAKLLFWSFVAGFSERLVPQIIGRVTSSATGDAPEDRRD